MRRLGSRRRPAEQPRSSAGAPARTGRALFDGLRRAALQRGGRVRRRRRADDQPRVDRSGPRSRPTTLHDVRWGAPVAESGVDEFRLGLRDLGRGSRARTSSAATAARSGERQPPMYFPRGGSTLKGVASRARSCWSRVYVKGARLHMDIGRGGVVRLSRRRDRAPLAGDHAAVAHHARRALRRRRATS